AVAALQVISTAVKEPTAFEWMFVNEDVNGTIPVTPCVVYWVRRGERRDHELVRGQDFKVANAEEGLAAKMAAYWLFGIAYGKKIYNTACLLERTCLKLSFSPLRAVAIKVVNKMLKN
ncbi:unnamed protein product, partial [Ixodes hexagonus]